VCHHGGCRVQASTSNDEIRTVAVASGCNKLGMSPRLRLRQPVIGVGSAGFLPRAPTTGIGAVAIGLKSVLKKSDLDLLLFGASGN
jgi:hypothetical protein